MKRNDLGQFLQNTNGQIFTVQFRKRSDGSIRTMNCRTKVKKHLTGGGPRYNSKDHNLLTVFDLKKKNYRAIPLEGVIYVDYGGKRTYIEDI